MEWFQEIFGSRQDPTIFGIDVPEEYGGMGLDDYRYNTILIGYVQKLKIQDLDIQFKMTL